MNRHHGDGLASPPRVRRAGNLARITRNYELYLFLAPTLLYFAVFHYGPMYGVQIAFKDFMASKGIWGSPWVGLVHFQRFFNSYLSWSLIANTLVLSLAQLAFGFPVPIILALLLNQMTNARFKSTVQTVTYAPHFISTVVMVGMLLVFLSPRNGLVNYLIQALGVEPVFFMGKQEWFRPLYVASGIWQSSGWSSIIYLAALSGVDPQTHEAAVIDGATKLQRILYVDVPGIIPTAVVLLILNMGQIMSVGFEKAFLMQTPLNLAASEIISTYVYKVGLLNVQFSFSAAVGLFNSAVNVVLITAVNSISRRVSAISLW